MSNNLLDQDSCVWELPAEIVGTWSTVEPYLTFFRGPHKGKVGVWAYDIMQQRAHVIAPPPPPGQVWGGLREPSPDGQWVCWLEGGQDTARRFGVAKTDGSLYRRVRWDGGVIFEQSPATLTPPPASTEGDSDIRGGMHGISFTNDPSNIMKSGIVGPLSATLPGGRNTFYDTNGKLAETLPAMSHSADSPDGKYKIFERGDGVSGRNMITGEEFRVLQSKGRTEGHTSWTNDPNWAEASWMGPYNWEILRLSMRGDGSVIRLCSVASQDLKAITYNAAPFGMLSPDGTKVRFLSSLTHAVNAYLVVAGNPRMPENLTGQQTAEGFKLTWTPALPSAETKGYRIYQTNKSGQAYKQIGWVDTPADRKVKSREPISFTVPGVKQGDKAFFAVRAQEWSGLLSRYSNDVASEAGMSVSTYIEPELCEFTGFKQGFDPQGASDMYYLFVPTEGTKCSVSFTNPSKHAQVWVRVGVGGSDETFTVNNARYIVPIGEPGDWTWINVKEVSDEIKLSSESKGFKLDRIFLSSDGSTPYGRGLDYPTDASPVVQVPADVKTKPLTPFAAEVTWAAIPGIRYYNVYASDKADFIPSQANLLYSPPAGSERVVDWGLKPATQYHYKVTAIDYDGITSKPSSAVAVTTPPITVQTVQVDYTSGSGGTVKEDKAASNGKMMVLRPGDTYTLKFNVPADGDYVIWHQWRMDIADRTIVQVEVNDKKADHVEWYHMGSLFGQRIGDEFLWSRYNSGHRKGLEGIYPMKAGENTLKITLAPKVRVKEFHLNKLIITNDQSFVPDGKLCIY
ncbi:MAG: fibronectin type III domain-containing protein, partial [Phycisphaerales bacterium]|nr:fibronectin type III domain-containing protein [Phycisphaerales bacterium]